MCCVPYTVRIYIYYTRFCVHCSCVYIIYSYVISFIFNKCVVSGHYSKRVTYSIHTMAYLTKRGGLAHFKGSRKIASAEQPLVEIRMISA